MFKDDVQRSIALSDIRWNQLQSKTLELDRLQFAGEMIRRIIRVRELSDKLRKIYAQVLKSRRVFYADQRRFDRL